VGVLVNTALKAIMNFALAFCKAYSRGFKNSKLIVVQIKLRIIAKGYLIKLSRNVPAYYQ
jgi:hypothetical protein